MDAAHVGGIGGTFGGNPISCAAALAVLEIMDDEKLPQRAIEIGSKVVSAINQLKKEVRSIKSIRGLGAMQGIEIVDQNGDGIIDLNDRTFIGNPNPDYVYGFNLSMSYKRLSLNALFNGVSGNDIANFNLYRVGWIQNQS